MPTPIARFQSILAHAPAAAHWTALAVGWGYLTVRAFLNFRPDWDFMAYHLPFALMHYGRTSYKPMPHLLQVYQGFPPLAELVQGALILATGRLSAACGIGMVGLAIALVGLRRLRIPGLSLRWYLTALVAVPLVLIHTNTGYIDLWVGAAMTLAFAASERLLAGDLRREAFAWFHLGLAIAMFSKFTAWPFCFVLGGATIAGLAYRAWCGGASARLVVVNGLVAVLVLAALPVRNVVRFGNPTFPWQPPFVGRQLPGLPQTNDPEFLQRNIPRHLWTSSRPRMLVESMFELSRWRTPEPMQWRLDQGFQPTSPHFRLGGWFFGTVAGLCLFLPLAAWRDAESRPSHVVLALMVLVLLGVPANVELRYWLFVPMSGLLLVVKALPCLGAATAAAVKGYLLFAAVHVVWMLLQQTPALFTPRFARAEQFIPAEARRYWATHPPAGPDDPWTCVNGKLPMAIFWAGPTLREHRVQTCWQ